MTIITKLYKSYKLYEYNSYDFIFTIYRICLLKKQKNKLKNYKVA